MGRSHQQEPAGVTAVRGADDVEEGVVLDVHARVQEERPRVLVHDFVFFLVEMVQRPCGSRENKRRGQRETIRQSL